MIDMETNDKKWTHPVIETRTQRAKLPNDITVEATFNGYEREADSLVITTMTGRVVFASKETVRMFVETISGLHFGSWLGQPQTDAERAAEAKIKAVAS